MKYANQDHEQFTPSGAIIAFCIGFIQFFIGIVCMIMNIIMLADQETVKETLLDFVKLGVIIEFPKLLFEALVDNPLKELMEHPIKIVKPGRENIFWERTYFHMFGRMIYKLCRLVHTILYYMLPYAIFIVHWITRIEGGFSAGEAEEGSGEER